MSVLEGCRGVSSAPFVEKRQCPKCGRNVEVYTVHGRVKEDVKCSCGFTFHSEF